MQVPSAISLAGAPLLLDPPSFTQSPDGSPTTFPTTWCSAPSEVLFDSPGGAAPWASGESCKASFEVGRMSFVPFLGSGTPRDFPLSLSLAEVRVGDRLLDLDRGAPPP